MLSLRTEMRLTKCGELYTMVNYLMHLDAGWFHELCRQLCRPIRQLIEEKIKPKTKITISSKKT